MSSGPLIGICAVREDASWAFWRQTAHLVADSLRGGRAIHRGAAGDPAVDPRHPEALLERIDGLLG